MSYRLQTSSKLLCTR